MMIPHTAQIAAPSVAAAPVPVSRAVINRAHVSAIETPIVRAIVSAPPHLTVAAAPVKTVSDVALISSEDRVSNLDKCFQVMMTSTSPTVASKLVNQYSAEGYIPLIGYPYQCDDKYNYYKVPTYNYAHSLIKKKAKKA